MKCIYKNAFKMHLARIFRKNIYIKRGEILSLSLNGNSVASLSLPISLSPSFSLSRATHLFSLSRDFSILPLLSLSFLRSSSSPLSRRKIFRRERISLLSFFPFFSLLSLLSLPCMCARTPEGEEKEISLLSPLSFSSSRTRVCGRERGRFPSSPFYLLSLSRMCACAREGEEKEISLLFPLSFSSLRTRAEGEREISFFPFSSPPSFFPFFSLPASGFSSLPLDSSPLSLFSLSHDINKGKCHEVPQPLPGPPDLPHRFKTPRSTPSF